MNLPVMARGKILGGSKLQSTSPNLSLIPDLYTLVSTSPGLQW